MASRYQIFDKIGVGGMARVLRAHDLRIDRDIAIKVLHSQFADNQEVQERFVTEIKTSGQLNHPNIVAIYDVGSDFYREIDGADPNDLDAAFRLPYLVMEYVPGIAFDKMIQYSKRPDFRLSLEVCYQIALALQTAHDNGIVHRDVKPSNILVREDGKAKLTDFGIARFVEAATAHNTMAGMGTAAYMSPEQIKGEKVVPASDVYSLGCTLFTALTGHTPFAMNNFAQVNKHLTDPIPRIMDSNPEVPLSVQNIINRSMAKDLADRYTTAQEMADELAEQIMFLGTEAANNSSAGAQVLSHLPSSSALPGMSALPGDSALPKVNAWAGLSHMPELFPPGSQHRELAEKQGLIEASPLNSGTGGSRLPGIGKPVLDTNTGQQENQPTRAVSTNVSSTQDGNQNTIRSTLGEQHYVSGAENGLSPVPVVEGADPSLIKPASPQTVAKSNRRLVVSLLSGAIVLILGAVGIIGYNLSHADTVSSANSDGTSNTSSGDNAHLVGQIGFQDLVWQPGDCLDLNVSGTQIRTVNCTSAHIYEVAKTKILQGPELSEIVPDRNNSDTWLEGFNSRYDDWCKKQLHGELPDTLTVKAYDQIWKREPKLTFQGAVRYCLIKDSIDSKVNTRSYDKYYR